MSLIIIIIGIIGLLEKDLIYYVLPNWLRRKLRQFHLQIYWIFIYIVVSFCMYYINPKTIVTVCKTNLIKMPGYPIIDMELLNCLTFKGKEKKILFRLHNTKTFTQ